jgi:tetratricopeptide (TPR) repeat protein
VNDWVDAEHHVERAHDAYDAGRWDEAENELRRALSLNPYQAEWHFNLGLTLEAAGRIGEAAKSFAEAFELRRDGGEADAQAALLAGINLVRAGDAGSGLAWLQKAEEVDPGSSDVAAQKILAFADLGRHDDAEDVFYIAQEHDPDHAELYAAMAESLMVRRLHDKAVWCLREAARLDPGLSRVQARLAEAYAATGRLERARQLYLRELRQDPGDVETLLDLGDLLVEMRRVDEASEKYRRVLEIEPDHPDAHFALGELAERRGNYDEAMIEYGVVLRLDGAASAARRRLAALLLDRGREEDLIRVKDLLRREAREQRVVGESIRTDDAADLGRLFLEASMAVEAGIVFRDVLKRRPGDHEAHHHLSVAMFEAGDVEGGLEQARQALVFEPRFVPAMYNMAVAHMRRREWTRAGYWVKRGSRVDPEDASMRRLRLRLRIHGIAWFGVTATRSTARGARGLWGASVGRPSRVGG